MKTEYLRKVTIIFLLFCINELAFSQAAKKKLNAQQFFDSKDYIHALEEFQKLYKDKKTDPIINHRIGACYLNINDDKSKAIPFLEFAYKSIKNDNELLIDLGLAYMYAYKFDEAISYFNIFKKQTSQKKNELADRFIQNCENAKELVKNPINVTFENLGKDINSPYSDYYPFVTKDEATLYFTTRRPQNQSSQYGFDGYYTSDIYFSKVKSGIWTKAKTAGATINSIEDEECVCLTPDGKTMIVYTENATIFGDLFITTSAKGKSFPLPEGFMEPINTAALELEAYINQEGNYIIFTSDRPGGYGGSDLYESRKLPNGEWGIPLNLGPSINTKYKEAFPVFDEENNILYFSSEGHNSMGGYDIFKCNYNPQTKESGQIYNMGYPINTPEDNMEFTLAGNKRDGYISAYRKEGLGDLDVYKVVFNDIEIKKTVLKGVINTNDSIKKIIHAEISLFDAKTNQLLESKKSHHKNNEFIFALNPGRYKITVNCKGYNEYSEELIIHDLSDYIPFINKQIQLTKNETSELPQNLNEKNEPLNGPKKSNKK